MSLYLVNETWIKNIEKGTACLVCKPTVLPSVVLPCRFCILRKESQRGRKEQSRFSLTIQKGSL